MAKRKVKAPPTQEDAKWRAESDMRAIREADEIMHDKTRMAAAMKAAEAAEAAMERMKTRMAGKPKKRPAMRPKKAKR